MAEKPVDPPSCLLLLFYVQPGSILTGRSSTPHGSYSLLHLKRKKIRAQKTKRTAEHASHMVTTSQELPRGCCSCNPWLQSQVALLPQCPPACQGPGEGTTMSKSVAVSETGRVAGGRGWSRKPDGKVVLGTAVPPRGKTFSLLQGQ